MKGKPKKEFRPGLAYVRSKIRSLKSEIADDREYLRDEETGKKIPPRERNLSEQWCARDLGKKIRLLNSLELIEETILKPTNQ